MTETIQKNNNSVPFSKCNLGTFIDNSGSTGSKYQFRTILDTERLIVNKITGDYHNANIVYWSTYVDFNKNAVPQGGTRPSCIFSNDKATSLFKTSDIILFMTDGEITQHDVTDFSNRLKSHLNKALYICVITNNHQTDLANLNVSVISPLMLASNMLCIYCDATNDKCYVIASKGPISNTYPNPSQYDIKSLKEIDLTQIREIDIKTQTIPNNYIVLSESDTAYNVVDINKIFDNILPSMSENDWNTIIKYCTVNNRLQQLRTVINKTKNMEIETAKNNIANTFEMKYIKMRDDIITKMVMAHENSDKAEQQRLKTNLDEIKDLARLEEIAYMNYVKNNLSAVKRKWEIVCNQIFQVENETNKYTLNTFSSNRARRATIITEDDTDMLYEKISCEGVPEIECAIHLDKGPMVLWFSEFLDDEYTTNDFCINFPLAYYPKLLSVLISNPVCGQCAESYINFRKETVYKQKTIGYIPLNLTVQNNMNYINNMLCRVFTKNKQLPHVKMLLLSVLDDSNYEWLENKQFIINQLIFNIMTFDSLSEEGTIKEKFIDVLPKIIKNDMNMFRQPFYAAARIMKFAAIYNKNMSMEIKSMLLKRFTYLMLEKFSAMSKNNLTSLLDNLDMLLFNTVCGIPVMNSIRDITLNDLKSYFGNDCFDCIMNFIDRLCNELGINKNDILTTNLILNVLWHLSGIKQHDRPMNIFKNLSSSSKYFREIGLDSNNTDMKPIINNNKFGKYMNHDRSEFPGYAFYNGRYSCPSKLWFGDKLMLNEIMGNNDVLNISITDLENKLNEIFKVKMIDRYGAVYPTNTSSHIMVHRHIAEVLESEFPNNNTDIINMVLACMRRIKATNGEYGNIYNPNTLKSVIVTVIDFCRIRQMNNYATNNENIDKTVRHKLIAELTNCGIVINSNNVTLDKSVLESHKPHMLNISGDEVNKIAEQVITVYNSTFNAKPENDTNKPNIVEVNYTEVYEIGDKNMSLDKYLEHWNKEQTDITAKIELTDTFDPANIKYVRGMDVSFSENEIDAVACLVIHDYKTQNMVARFTVRGKINIPYKAGYLAFREAEILFKLLENVQNDYPELVPDVILMDGNGIWHHRGCGIASHFAVLTGVPCVGISKNVLCVDGIDKDNMREFLAENAPNKGDSVKIIGDSGKELGYAFNVTGSTIRATYVSPGSYISMETSIEIVKRMSKYRVSETIRQADLISRMLVE